MERDFGVEMTRVFGARLKRVYELDETALPPQIAQWLERLRHAEQEMMASAEPDAGRPRAGG